MDQLKQIKSKPKKEIRTGKKALVSFFFTPGYHKSTLFEGNVQKYIHKCLLFQKYEYLYGVHRDGHYNLIDKKRLAGSV